jgi:hypothetical protein
MLVKTSSVSAACLAVKVSRVKAYNHRNRFPKFRAKWDEALEVATEMLEAEVNARAFDRTDPSSATLAIFLLKAHKPEKYREVFRRAAEIEDVDVTKLTDEQLQAIAGGPGGGGA